MSVAEERRRQDEAVFEAVYRRYEGQVIHPTMRWYSLNPDTGQWDNDRMWGRRLQILDDLYWERRDTEWQSWQSWRDLGSRPGQYAFLNRNSRRFRELPVPEGARFL